MIRFKIKAWRGVALAALWVASPGYAYNKGSLPGAGGTSGCSVNWVAKTVMDVDLKNDDPTYPDLMVTPDGTPIASYSNGGYIMEVRPENGQPGIFEITHWYSNAASPSVEGATVNWRIPVATDYAIQNPKVTVKVPAGLNVVYGFAASPANISNWGDPYSRYEWAAGSSAVNNGDGTWTITLDNLDAHSGTVFTLSGTVPKGTVLTDQYIIEASLSGNYVRDGGAPSCVTPPPAPVPTQSGEGLLLTTVGIGALAGFIARRRRQRKPQKP